MPLFTRIENIKAGMVISEAIQNNFGQTVIPKDFRIEEKHLKLLKLWNIAGAMIKQGDEDKQVVLSPVSVKDVKSNLESRMKWKAENLIETNLFTSAVKFLAENE